MMKNCEKIKDIIKKISLTNKLLRRWKMKGSKKLGIDDERFKQISCISKH